MICNNTLRFSASSFSLYSAVAFSLHPPLFRRSFSSIRRIIPPSSSVSFPFFRSLHCSSITRSNPSFSSSASSSSIHNTDIPLPPSRHRIVVLGSGWSSYQLLRTIHRSIDVDQRFEIYCISPRNYFLFTPLLTSTTVGTLEYRAIVEPLRLLKNVKFILAEATDIDTKNNQLHCVHQLEGHNDKNNNEKIEFSVDYHSLIIGMGATANTFNTPGVHPDNSVYFLKQINDSRSIRNKLIENFENASHQQFVNEEMRKKWSTVVIVGGGPTSIEFAAELNDFITHELKSYFPTVHPEVILVESSDHLLGAFDATLSDYVMNIFKRRPTVKLLLQKRVIKVENEKVYLSDGSIIPYGLMVWATGNTPLTVVKNFAKKEKIKTDRSGRLITNEHLQLIRESDNNNNNNSNNNVSIIPNVFAMGDCMQIDGAPLPATAQVASQMGIYLGKLIRQYDQHLKIIAKSNNNIGKKEENKKFDMMITKEWSASTKPFFYNYRGMLAYVGDYLSVADLKSIKWSGLTAWMFWRSAYLTQLMSWRNKLVVLFFWFKSFVFGRDISRF